MFPITPLILTLSSILLGGLFLSLPSIINNYPLIFNDSGFYLLYAAFGGHEKSMIWRPLTYSLFLKGPLSLGGLTFFVIVQNIFLAGVIRSFLNLFVRERANLYFAFIVFFLGLTSFIHYSNFIMPDIFTGFLAIGLCGALLSANKKVKVLWWSLFVVSMMMHNSNMVAGSLLLITALILNRSQKMVTTLLPILIAPWLLLPLLHLGFTGRFIVSNSAYVYLYSQLSTFGITNEYLKNNCEGKGLKLCENPKSEFHIWDTGPNTKIGEAGGISNLTPELKQVTQELLMGPKFIQFLRGGLSGLYTQLVYFSAPLAPVTTNSYLEYELKTFSEKEAAKFSKQSLNYLSIDNILFFQNFIYLTFTWLSLALLCFFAFKKWLSPQVRTLFLYSALTYFLNALVCALFTEPTARYSGRMVWLFPFVLLLHAVFIYSSKKRVAL